MSMHVTLRQLRAFTAVVETGTFSEAAKTMHLSQAALSGLIKELETQVGVRLLDRNTRSVSASTVGQAFEPMVRRLLADLDVALESVVNLRELRRGLVRVAAPETLSCTLLPELIAMFHDAHPGIEVRFDDVPIEEVKAGLQNGNVDIGFGPASSIDDEAIDSHQLWTDPLWVALHPDDPLKGNDSVSWKDLQDRPMITYMRNFGASVLSQVPARNHPKEVIPVQRVNTALSMLRVRQGAVVCPSMTGSLVQGFGLMFLPLRQPVVSRSIAVFARTRSGLSPAIESFLEFTLNFARTWVAIAQETGRAHQGGRRIA